MIGLPGLLTPAHSALLYVLTVVAALAACNSTPPAVVSPASPRASAAAQPTTAPATSAAIVEPAESQPVSVELPMAKEICVGYQSPMEQDARNVSSVRKFRWLRPPCDPSRSQDLRDYRDCVPGVHESCADLQFEGHSYRVRSNASSTSYAVLRDNDVVYRGELMQPYAFAPLYNLSLWDGKWVLEVNEDIIIDGVSLNQEHGYRRSYHWVLWRGHPLYFFEQDGNVRISYAERTLPDQYGEVIHHQCCSGMMFNIGSCGERTSFYAKRGPKWYMVDLLFANPTQGRSNDDRERTEVSTDRVSPTPESTVPSSIAVDTFRRIAFVQT